MRLQRLEISGFKSFPDRADLAFDRGVTAIVGPNGCGKSNVVDAITWVLGEQSAKSLRGERMEDVIFSGSDARKATAAAEVRLKLSGVVTRPRTGENGQTLDGFEIEEPGSDDQPLTRDVELARRLYRSGESEYLLDGHVCRLKDIQDLLMDVGIGVKGYAVIEQGKIGQILSAKPTDRRQLIEEAAGVTKFKSRRRAAELKLEAAQQNLTRIDDIVFELDKQRGALKRQAAKARRYRKLREELRQWEKLLFAQRYDVLGAAIHTARENLAQTRERETLAAARVAELEADLERLRIELTEADAKANALRADAHNRELENGRRQQQITFNAQQVDSLAVSARDIAIELEQLEARRAPGLQELEARRDAGGRADEERDRASQALAEEERAQADTQRDIAGLERAVDTARGVVFAKLNAQTTLKHAIERAEEARNRIADDITRLDVEASDLRIEIERLGVDRERAAEELRLAQDALETTHAARATSEAELGTARIEREWRVRDARSLEREVAATAARVKSLEELEAARAAYGDAARLVLASHEHGISHGGSVADYLEVDRDYERVIEACFSDLLQYVIVHTARDAERGLAFVRERNAGRVGFLIAAESSADALVAVAASNNWAAAADPTPVASAAESMPSHLETTPAATAVASGRLTLGKVLRINGPYSSAVRGALGDVLIVDTFDEASRLSTDAGPSVAVATKAGEVFRGGRLVSGGGRDEGHGILVTKREIKELREKLTVDQQSLQTLTDEITGLDAAITQAEQTIKAHEAERHRHEKSILQAELQVSRAKEELDRLARRQELGANERRRFEDERHQLEQRQEEARQSILALADEHRESEEALALAQQQLLDGRERLAEVARRASEAKAVHAALVERASAIANEVRRLEEAARELDARIAGRADERARMEKRREDLAASIVENQRQLDQDLVVFGDLKQQVASLDERVNEVQIRFQEQEHGARGSRADLDTVRSEATQLEIARATAESDLSHLATVCQETLQLTLDEVASEVAALTAAGNAIPAAPVAGDEESAEGEESAEAADADSEDAAAVQADAGETQADGALAAAAADGDAGDEAMTSAVGEGEAAAAAATPRKAAARPMTPEAAIAMLKKKIDRLGPVNMMAIEQFDELETRHAFLTTQRKDLLDSIAQTGEAIKRIEKTTRERFHEAFTTINVNFGEMFTTLFGGGRAGLVLLDESDALESGIDIIAQPPGKRLQNVQLLSGGEKALTAMALMFGIFRYRPSPFCLLDEIDAPLDDANIGRFVEMLRGMNDQTQFILITHHRKTMEIADRLYGVTMEEPGVSKLISLELN